MTSADDDDREPVPFPVRVAGWVWLGYGTIHLLITLALVLLAQAARADAVCCCMAYFGSLGLLGCLFGDDARKGLSRDLLAPAVGSIVLGVLHIMAAAAVVATSLGNGRVTAFGLGLAGTLAPPGAALVFAGVLALRARTAYLEWRQDFAPPREPLPWEPGGGGDSPRR